MEDGKQGHRQRNQRILAHPQQGSDAIRDRLQNLVGAHGPDPSVAGPIAIARRRIAAVEVRSRDPFSLSMKATFDELFPRQPANFPARRLSGAIRAILRVRYVSNFCCPARFRWLCQLAQPESQAGTPGLGRVIFDGIGPGDKIKIARLPGYLTACFIH